MSIVLVACATISQLNIVGQIAIGVYAIAVLLFRIPSAEVFKLALGALGAVVITQLLDSSELGNTFAVYAYLLLCAGTIRAIIEVRRHHDPA
jgi:energy-converting hydrogenase Eha subunit C